jgi:hypothetical protein
MGRCLMENDSLWGSGSLPSNCPKINSKLREFRRKKREKVLAIQKNLWYDNKAVA